MNKPKVFISHITEEQQLANDLKIFIEDTFLGLIDVFVSSTQDSISVGERWLDKVTDALNESIVEIVICSHLSIKRPWINFEAGAGWIRNIPVIPFCHSGMTLTQLPTPLNMLQGAIANEPSSIEKIVRILAESIGARVIEPNISEFITKVKSFEEHYTFWDLCNSNLESLNNHFNNELITELKSHPQQVIKLFLTETELNFVKKIMEFLTSHDILKLEQTGSMAAMAKGMTYQCFLIPMNQMEEILDSPNLKMGTSIQ
ncbi:toll/interleukin-1 receptor domain-containing protein [Priestia aryabhattai]|uniref:toll/interleukin-1 receptor domain-containing protein n=1 Tax=Priestia aryabhattai TaxID=412384 RepID=UPI001CFC5AFF|nr:toll/interleukin-1 receptor domain-containing protein [Priestia aryabhattai]